MVNRGVGQVKAGVLDLYNTDKVNYEICLKIKRFISRYVESHMDVYFFSFDLEKGIFTFGENTTIFLLTDKKILVKFDYYSHELIVESNSFTGRIPIDFMIKTITTETKFFDIFNQIVDIYMPIYDVSTNIVTTGEIYEFNPLGGKIKEINYIVKSQKSTLCHIIYYKIFDDIFVDEKKFEEKVRICYKEYDGIEVNNRTVEFKIGKSTVFHMSNNYLSIYNIQDHGDIEIKILHDTPKY